MANEKAKEIAGRAAAELVRRGDVVGLGTGSTAYFAVVALGERVKAGLKIIGIPTSVQTGDLARAVGIRLTTLDEHPEIDVTVDGADEVDPRLQLIKGGGGAHLREKVVNYASSRNVIVVDETKLSARLGEKWHVPVEVVRFAHAQTASLLGAIGQPTLRRKDAAVF